MQERIRIIRTQLGINQRDFSAKSKIGHSTLAMFETGQRMPKDIHISQICQAFSVNEHWLRTGQGPMWARGDSELAQIIQKNNLDGFAQAIIRLFIDLEPQQKTALLDYAKRVASEYKNAAPMDGAATNAPMVGTVENLEAEEAASYAAGQPDDIEA